MYPAGCRSRYRLSKNLGNRTHPPESAGSGKEMVGMAEPTSEQRQQASKHAAVFAERDLPGLLEDHYGEWAVLDAGTGSVLDVRPAPEAFALAYERPVGEVLLEQVCEPVPMTVGACTLVDL